MFPTVVSRRKLPFFVPTLFALIACAAPVFAQPARSGPVVAQPAGAAYVMVLNSDDDTVSLIDPHTHVEVSRQPLGRGPHHMMPLPDDSALLIGLTTVNQLLVVDRKTGAITKRISMMDPYQLGFSPDARYFVTTALRQDFVDIYPGKLTDNVKPLARVKSGVMPSHISFSQDSRFVYVTEQGSGTVSKIDLAAAKVVNRVPVGRAPAGIWTTPDGRHLLVGVMGENYVAVIDTATDKVVNKIITGRGAHNFVAKGDKRHIYVTNRVDDTVSLIDMQTMKVIESFKVPGTPDDMELSADGKWMWVTARSRMDVVVINMETRQVEKRIRVGRSPHGIYYFDHAPRQ